MSTPESDVTCPKCGEVQSSDFFLCARCGTSLETKAQHQHRLADLEQSRREAERNDVSIQRLPGFGVNGTPRAMFGTKAFFSEMSNQMRRRYAIVAALVAIFFVLLITLR